LRGIESIADAAYCVDQLRLLRIVLDLRAQPLHGDVDEARVAEVVVVPDQLEQQLARENLLRPARELEQQPELGRRERDILATSLDAVRAGIALEPADRDHAARRPCPCP